MLIKNIQKEIIYSFFVFFWRGEETLMSWWRGICLIMQFYIDYLGNIVLF